jgi:hypothetical protein
MYAEFLCLLPFVSVLSGTIVGILATRKYGRKGIVFALGTSAIVMALTFSILNKRLDDLHQQDRANTNAVLSGAFTTLEHLSVPDGVEQVTVSSGASCSDSDNCRCYYAQVYVLFGAHFPAPIAFDRFIQQLQTSGWSREGTDYPESRGFIQGDYVYLNLDHNGGSDDLWSMLDKQIDYISATAKYSGTLNMRIDYMLPSRKICRG